MLTRNPTDAENPAIRHVNRFEAWSEQRAGEIVALHAKQEGVLVPFSSLCWGHSISWF
jgi:hypothetical protein